MARVTKGWARLFIVMSGMWFLLISTRIFARSNSRTLMCDSQTCSFDKYLISGALRCPCHEARPSYCYII